MQSQTFTLSGLSVELGVDRRTIAKMLDDLPAAETEPDGKKRWKLRAVLAHIEKRKASDVGQSATDQEGAWIGHELTPAIFGSKTFMSIFMRGLRDELGMSKRDVLRTYLLLFLALAAELERAGIPDIKLPPLAERIMREGFDVVAADWTDSPQRHVDG